MSGTRRLQGVRSSRTWWRGPIELVQDGALGRPRTMAATSSRRTRSSGRDAAQDHRHVDLVGQVLEQGPDGGDAHAGGHQQDAAPPAGMVGEHARTALRWRPGCPGGIRPRAWDWSPSPLTVTRRYGRLRQGRQRIRMGLPPQPAYQERATGRTGRPTPPGAPGGDRSRSPTPPRGPPPGPPRPRS